MMAAGESPICTRRIEGPGAWKASDFSNESDWIIHLDESDIEELRVALAHSRATGKPMEAITAEDFPLCNLAEKLRMMLDDLEFGKGFAVIRGFPLEAHPSQEIEFMYWGIGVHLGEAVAQNALGERLSHVRDYGKGDISNNALRAYQTSGAIPFHTDSADVVGLLCLRPAREGGTSMLASSITIHNELLEHHRELLGILYTGFLYDRRGEELPGETPYYRNCVYTWLNGQLSCRFYVREFIESAQAKTGLPLVEVERLALDTFEAIASLPENMIEMRLRPGDVQFCDNNIVVHARTAYRDMDNQRDLLRLWVNPRNARKLGPFSAKFRYGMPTKGNDQHIEMCP